MKNTKRKSAVSAVVFIFLAVLLPFLAVFLTGVCTPAQYAETYYGELSAMVSRLEHTKGKKVVVLGNSAVAFGVDSALAQKLLREAGLEYSVCNFGLYGALGTKMMTELALGYVGKGDIVVLMPELYEQSLSLYFSAEEAWYALDSDMSLFFSLSSSSRSALAGNYFGYTAKKLSLYREGKPAEPSGVYAKSSFDENCDLKNFARPANVMPDGVDANNPVSLSGSLFSSEFVDYVNDFAARIAKKGAETVFAFAPVNEDAIAADSPQTVDEFYDTVAALFEFPLLGDLRDSVMECEWFYDSNFHLNESGMTVYTARLVNGLKNVLGNTTKTQIALPEKPALPDPDAEGEGDNSCADLFVYRLDGSYYTVVGLTEEGVKRKELILPYQVDGVYVRAFLPAVFMHNAVLESVTVQDNIRSLSDGSFVGCSNLKSILLLHTEPTSVSVGYGLFDGAPNDAAVYVPQEALSQFRNNYFWGRYANRLQGH